MYTVMTVSCENTNKNRLVVVSGFWRSRDAGTWGDEDAEQFDCWQDGKGEI